MPWLPLYIDGVDAGDLRKQRSAPVLEKLKRWLVLTHQSEPPSSDLAKATGYILNHWDALTRFVDDGRLSLDNNLSEQQLRDIALAKITSSLAPIEPRATPRSSTASHEPAPRTTSRPFPTSPTPSGKSPPAGLQSRIDELLPHRWQSTPADE